METLKLEHRPIPFITRLKHYLLMYVGVLAFGGLLVMARDGKRATSIIFFLVMTIGIGLIIANKIKSSRNFLIGLYSDNQNVEIDYLEYSEKKKIKTKISDISYSAKNTSSRAGFNCVLILKVNDLKFEINRDFDWSFNDIKKLIVHLNENTQSNFSENEKHILERIQAKLERDPFS